MVTGWPGTEVPALWSSLSFCPGPHHGSIWPPALEPPPLLPSSCALGLCLHFPWQGNRDSAWKEFSCSLPSLQLNPSAAGHEPWPATGGGQGAGQPAAASLPTARAVRWGQQVSSALGLSWAGMQSLAGAGMVRGENSGLPHGGELGVVPMSRSAASGNMGVLGVRPAQAALVALQSLVQDVSSHTRFLCSEETFVHGCLR